MWCWGKGRWLRISGLDVVQWDLWKDCNYRVSSGHVFLLALGWRWDLKSTAPDLFIESYLAAPKFYFFSCSCDFGLSYSPKRAKAGLNFLFPCWKKNHQGIQFSYRRIAHTYCECYSEDNSASGIALSKRTAAGTKQFSYNLLCEAKTCWRSQMETSAFLVQLPSGRLARAWGFFFTLKQEMTMAEDIRQTYPALAWIWTLGALPTGTAKGGRAHALQYV